MNPNLLIKNFMYATIPLSALVWFAFSLVDFCPMNCYSLLAYATKWGELFTNMTVIPKYEDRRKTARALYEQYGKPLEAEHKGEYVAISNSRNIIVGKSLTEVVTHSIERFGKGNFVFKIGSQAVGSFRWATSSLVVDIPSYWDSR